MGKFFDFTKYRPWNIKKNAHIPNGKIVYISYSKQKD